MLLIFFSDSAVHELSSLSFYHCSNKKKNFLPAASYCFYVRKTEILRSRKLKKIEDYLKFLEVDLKQESVVKTFNRKKERRNTSSSDSTGKKK